MMKILGVMAAAGAAWLLGGWLLCVVVMGLVTVLDVMAGAEDAEAIPEAIDAESEEL